MCSRLQFTRRVYGPNSLIYGSSLAWQRYHPVDFVVIVTQHKLSDIITITLPRVMSRLESACNCDGVARENAASHASRASDAHMPSATKRASSNLANSRTRYEKTAAILLGWEPDCCDTGVAPEVSFHVQPRSTDAC
jgi:hypothetical protein